MRPFSVRWLSAMLLVAGAAWLSGCTTAILTPIVLGEYAEHKRHGLMTAPPLAPLPPAAPEARLPDVVVERFAVAGEPRRYFDELWLLPLLPWTERSYPLGGATPPPVASDPVWIPLVGTEPPKEPKGPNYEAWRGQFLWLASEEVAKAPVPADGETIVRARLAASAGGAIEARTARALRAAMPSTRVAGVAEAAPMKLAWRFADDFDREAFARDVCERQAVSGSGRALRVALRPGEDIALAPEFDPTFAREAPLRIEGVVQVVQMEKRRYLWLLTMLGSDYLALLGVPQSQSRYAVELVLTARSARGDVAAARTIEVRTRRRPASLWYGYGKMRDRAAAELEERLVAELDAFAREVAAGASIAAK